MKWLKISGVVIGALALTSLSIDASDTLRGKSGSMLGQIIGSEVAVCPAGMAEVTTALTFTCVDTFEASVSLDCPAVGTFSQLDTESNLSDSSCLPATVSGALPWGFVTREQASRLCARAGKRLPTAGEWYQFAIDTKAANCAVNSTTIGKTGAMAACTSAFLVHDTVGNAWEWVADDVLDGKFGGRALPPSGYVTQVDQAGVATLTDTVLTASEYEGAYFWSQEVGAYAMIRGGYYGSKKDAGVYAIHAHTPPNFTGEAIGFRCVR